jgi:hypothetical protein
MSYAQWRNSYTFFFCLLGYLLILVLRFYSGLSGSFRTLYLFSLCVVSLLSSRFTACIYVYIIYSVVLSFSYVFGGPLFYFTEHCVHL